ncbi:hypothetical protein BJX99DRAFT_265400 [Aspergillus californicus]
MARVQVDTRWSPGHIGIEGNKAADGVANLGATEATPPTNDLAVTPSASGLRRQQHIVMCPRARQSFRRWPGALLSPPFDQAEAIKYLRDLSPRDFTRLLEVTRFYAAICPFEGPLGQAAQGPK